MASYIKTLKRYAIDKRISDESFVNRLFETIIVSENIKDKNGQELSLDKSRVSKLLSNKDDVPRAIRESLNRYGIRKRLSEEFEVFVDEILDGNCVSNLVDDIIKLITEDNDIKSEIREKIIIHKNNASEFLTATFIEAIKADNKILQNDSTIIWENGSNNICVIAGDLFNYGFKNRSKMQKTIVVIPVNTAFDTHITTKLENEMHPLVSENTIHGKWLLNWTKSGRTTEKLDQRISENLDKQGINPIKKSSSPNGKKECYDIGTIVAVECDRAIFYLLSIAEFDYKNNAISTKEQISKAALNLLEYYNAMGQGYKMYLPLMGTGRSRANLSYQESMICSNVYL